MKRLILMPMLVIGFSFAALAQQPNEQRAAVTDAAIAFDAKSAPALEARLRTQVLNGSDENAPAESQCSCSEEIMQQKAQQALAGFAQFRRSDSASRFADLRGQREANCMYAENGGWRPPAAPVPYKRRRALNPPWTASLAKYRDDITW